MQYKPANGLIAFLIAIAVITSSSGLAYLSLAGTDFITNQFNEASLFYGKNIFKNTSEQCEFIDSRLADPNLRNPAFIDKYTKNRESLNCSVLEARHGSANPDFTLNPAQLSGFLHQASSGEQTYLGSNNFFAYLLHLTENQATGTGAGDSNPSEN